MFSRITSILQAIYIILALIIGITILLHIFKIRYLDYYEIVENVDEDNSEINKEVKTKENIINTTNNKIFLENKNNLRVFLTVLEWSYMRILNACENTPKKT